MSTLVVALLTAALTCLVTTIVSQTVLYLIENGKRTQKKRREEHKQALRETIREEVKPLEDKIEESNEKIEEANQKWDTDVGLIKGGMQQLIKIDLQNSYEYWLKKKYAPIAVKNDLEKLYQVYHDLGRNGVMDSMREQFNRLPNEKPGR